MARYTLLLTQRCNLRCGYCYIEKHPASMSLAVATRAIDLIFERIASDDKVDIGFFGGEPLLELDLLFDVARVIESHPDYRRRRVVLSVTTNGTLLTEETAARLNAAGIQVCISCDGPAAVHDRFRRFPDGQGSAAQVHQALRRALAILPAVRVNAVFRPETMRQLPETVAWFGDLGVDQIYLNPDFSAPWSKAEIDDLYEVYAAVGEIYKAWHRTGNPRFVSMIDAKIAVILSGGYRPADRCQMGVGELAFSPDGHIFPCERLVGNGRANPHCIGTVADGVASCDACKTRFVTLSTNTECAECGIREYCMRWCGCSNFMASGRCDRVSPFLCASEHAAVRVAFEVFQVLSDTLGARVLESLIARQHGPAPRATEGRCDLVASVPRRSADVVSG